MSEYAVMPQSTLARLPICLHALDRRIPGLAAHSLAVARGSLALARALGIGGMELAWIGLGAYLHDMGKAALPAAIINKAGALTDGERALVRLHPVIGLGMLAQIPFLQPAAEIALTHHEHWDGSGYPLRLCGKEIPLGGRICAVVDVYEALTQDRPYRKAWSEAQARAYLRQGAGAQFDPQVVETFLRVIPEVRQ